jgi:DNA-binding transcriptional MerR regulator
MNKAAEAFRTIGEVAEELDVPKHVLRFWEGKFPQIRPMKRGGGRRYYRPEDMELLRGIRHLLHAEGYTIKGVQKILREQGIDQVKTLVREAASASAHKTRGKNSPKAGKAEARKPAPAASHPGAAGAAHTHAPVEKAALSRPEMILSIIAELEYCRSLLRDGASPVPEPVRQASRAARS